MKNSIKQFLSIAILLVSSIAVWAGDINQGTVSNATITFSTAENGTYTATLSSVAANTTIYMKVVPSSGYYITNSAITLTKGIDIGSAQARRRTIADPGADVNVEFTGSDPEDLSTVRTYTFNMPTNGADVIIDASAIARTSITAAVVTAVSKTYTGAAQTADAAGITVTLGETPLTQGTDYEITTNNGGTNVGTYAVVVTGKSIYTGTATGTEAFAITQAANSFTTQPTIEDWTFGETANAPTGGVAAFGTSTITYKYCATADGTYGTYADVVNGLAGAWYVKGFVEATTNYAAAESNAIPFTIANATMTGITATAYNAAYDGSAHGITLNGVPTGATIKYRLTDSGDYALTENPTLTNVGTQTVYYKVSQTNYDDVTGSSTVTITQAANSFTTQPTITGWTYGASANEPMGGVAAFGEITYKYSNAAEGTYGTYDAIVNGLAGAWYVKGFVEATTNYAAAESNAIPFTIANAAMTGITATAYNDAYDGFAHGITLNGVPTGATIKYRLTDSGDYELTENPTLTNVGTQTVYYKVSQTNYDDVTGSSTVTITAKDITAASINDITAPVTDATSFDTEATATLTATPAVSAAPTVSIVWKQGNNNATGSVEAETVYKAVITVTNTDGNYKFANTPIATVTGATTSVSRTSDNIIVITATYPATATRTVSFPENGDAEATLEGLDGKTADITINRTFHRDGYYNTICLPLSLSAAEIAASPLAGATIKELSSATTSNGKVTLTFSEVTSIQANKPYIIKWAAGSDIVNPTFNNALISYVAESQRTVTKGDVKFIGIYKPTALPKNDKNILILGEQNVLYYVNDETPVKAFRAYFVLSGTAASARYHVIDSGDDDTTGINRVKDNNEIDDIWYNLNGRRLNGKPSVKGMYIHNGRKEVVK